MRIALIVLLSMLSMACAGARPRREGADKYKNFAGMRAANAEGRDYSREVYNRGSKTAVFAVHGGDIELCTARVARKIAGDDLNLYIFNGWLQEESRELHITSAHFDDPDAVLLATSSVLGISVHTQAERGSQICVGGANKEAAGLVVSRLAAAGFSAQTPCPRLPGVSPANIVNLPAKAGVQLEISTALMERLCDCRPDLSKFVQAVRKAAFDYLKIIQGDIK